MRLRSLSFAAALALAGCGGGGPNEDRYDGDSKEVAAVIDDLQEASRDGDAEKICKEIFADEFRVGLERQTRTSCEERIDKQLVSDDAEFTVKDVRIDSGRRAVVNVTDQENAKSVLYFNKQDDDWRLIQIAR